MQHHQRNAERRQGVLARSNRFPRTTLAYLAGFFDGEGSVMADVRMVADATNKSPTATVKIGNTDEKPLLLFARVFGGQVRREPDLRRAKRNRPMFTYRVYENSSRVILERLLPYLITKRPQAELALRLYRLKDTLSPKEFSWTAEVFERVQQLRELNSTGHLKGRKRVAPHHLKPKLLRGEIRTIAEYLNSADARLVRRNTKAGTWWFRVIDVEPGPLERLRTHFDGSVGQKGRRWCYQATLETARRMARRLERYLDRDRFSSLLRKEVAV